MCWSATADLVAGTTIGAIGVYCVVRVRTPRELPLAALPLLLGAHQVVESVVWRHGGGTGWATLTWAVIALPLLPLWVSIGVLLVTPGTARPRLLIPLVAGVVTTGVLCHALATRTVVAEIRGNRVGYLLDLPQPLLVVAGYLLATVGALLLSGDPILRLLGILTGAGAVVCVVLWRTEFVSTWCALAAIVSVVLLVWVRNGSRRAGVPRGAF
ncbi:DUF6629 family protein [Streptomyces sp. NPDC005963]|uniref:DUF6629 family protein n=1 Tax=Streptomyces sp. NPDC005963 TaxID=3156721 RepID=UPI0033FDC387